MKIYTLERTQVLPITQQEAWEFFSTPANLQKITPGHMGFRILYKSGGDAMYPGQLIQYKVNGIPYVPMNWVTEITHVQKPSYFVDEQRFGPYALWHHQHHFKPVPEGIEMTDIVNYAIPLGPLGRLANWLFVERSVNAIFNHRYKTLETYFSKQHLKRTA